MPAQPTTLRLNSFVGGVATTPATKRLITEVSQANNVMLSLENAYKKSRF